MIPDARLAELQEKRRRSEAISLCAAVLIDQNQWLELQSILRLVASKDSSIRSIGVRKSTGELTVHTQEHATGWESAQKDQGGGTLITYEVPLVFNKSHDGNAEVDSRWGNVELVYRLDGFHQTLELTQYPIINLVIFFVCSSLVTYTYLIGRVMGFFHTTQVVPDRVRQALDTLAEGLLILDDKDRIILANQAFANLAELPPEKLAGKPVAKLSWSQPEGQKSNVLPWTAAKGKDGPITDHLLVLHANPQSPKVLSVNATPLSTGDGTHRGCLASFRDVTQLEAHRHALEEMLSALQTSRNEIARKNLELEVLATQDPLTACLNRRSFLTKLAAEWQLSIEHGRPMSCLMIDNDHFKQVNDNYGHQVGDEVLRAVAAILREAFGGQGLVCRYGGEEFCVILPNKNAEQALSLAELARGEIERVRLASTPDLRITASIGLSDLEHNPADPQELIHQADISLYRSKKNGRNRVTQFQLQFTQEENWKNMMRVNHRDAKKSQVAIPFPAVSALLSALSYRDSATADHSRRVANLAVTTAQGLLTNQEIYRLEIAALLHDIGKIGVPDDILLKPGKLSDEEWEIMGRYDRIGIEIVAGTFQDAELTDILQHHTKPFAKKSQDVPSTGEWVAPPLSSRILAICDAYDAIVSDRPHRPGRSSAEACAELRRCAGTQFDPDLVECFISALEAQDGSFISSAAASDSSYAARFGMQIERLAVAVDARDKTTLGSIASRLEKAARQHGVLEIAEVALKIEQNCFSEQMQWLEVLKATNELMEICRSSQVHSIQNGIPEPHR